ncbi:MAG TPA: hypothetical protein VF518_07840, partial [Polyangia bacterium]
MAGQTDLKEFILQDINHFTELGSQLKLRSYQQEAAALICRSVIQSLGLSFVVMFPRQSGKNELQAQIEAYLLALLSQQEAEIVKVSPTYKPQTLNAMRRLQRVLEKNLVTANEWSKESGYIFRLARARIIFLSGSPEANIVGATASTLLEVDEAQDVEIAKFDKDIAPMAASTDATCVFWGTAWTSSTLLGRELRAARLAQAEDGQRRVFVLTADDVGREVPAYGRFVAAQVARLGRSSPLVRTQFFSEEIDAEGGMFPAERVGLMQGRHPPLAGPGLSGCGPLFDGPEAAPTPAPAYCLLVDLAGEDAGAADGAELHNPGRDATALTIVEVDLGTLADPLIQAPTYKVVQRRQWVGAKQSVQYAELLALARGWNARWLVVDATGVGAGLASFLGRALAGRVIPFVFSSASKSELGWKFLALVDAGRWKEFSLADSDSKFQEQARLQAEFFNQLAFCQYEILPGPEKKMKWGVPDGKRDPANGALLHDDLVVSAALACVLDGQKWGVSGPVRMIRARD